MLVTDEAIFDFLQMEETDGDAVNAIKLIKLAVEAWLSKYCHRTFETTTYTELYDGIVSTELYLKNYPIKEITELKIDDMVIDSTTYLVYNTKGMIYYSNGFTAERQGISVEYTSGFDSTAIPEDLQMVVKFMVKNLYGDLIEDTSGVKSYSIGDVYVAFEKGLFPGVLQDIIDRYRRVLI